MKFYLKLLLVLTLLLSMTFPVLAQSPDMIKDLEGWKRSGQAAMPFLSLGGGARFMAMGDAGSAVTGDASSLFYNPAGIAYIEKNSVMLGNMDYLLDTSVQTAAFAKNFGALGVFGVSALFYNYGDPIMATEIDASAPGGYRDIGEMEPSEYAIGLGYARQISEQFAIGGQVKIAHQDLLGGNVSSKISYQKPDGSWLQEEHDAKTTIFVMDFGTVYNTGFRDMQLAMSFRNFGQEVEYERDGYDIPLTFRFGVSGSVFKMLNKTSENMDLLFNVDYMHPRDWSERINAGIEYSFNNMLYIRGGYKFNYTSEGLTLGGGVNLDLPMGNVKIDYAYKSTQDTQFDAVHVYSIGFNF